MERGHGAHRRHHCHLEGAPIGDPCWVCNSSRVARNSTGSLPNKQQMIEELRESAVCSYWVQASTKFAGKGLETGPPDFSAAHRAK